MTPRVSVCIPVKNGAGRLEHCLAAMRRLDYPQDCLEIIVADGGSTDATVEVAHRFGAIVVDNPAQIVATGRNAAFAIATGEFIASTDDDVVVPANWITAALGGFDDPRVAAAGGISIIPEDTPDWASAANYVFRQVSKTGNSVQADYLPDGIVDDLPGCNVFYRAALIKDMAFNAGLVTAEDAEFHSRLRAQGHLLMAVPGLFVWHHKRPTPQGLFRQMRRYAEGRVQLGRLAPNAVSPLHKLIGWSLPAMLIGLFYAPLIAVTLAAVLWAASAFFAWRDGQNIRAAVQVPLSAMVVATGWSTGWMKETLRPMKSTRGR